MRAPRIRSHLHFSALSYHLQIIHTDNIEKMTEGIRAQHPPASKLHNHVILRMIMTADLALLLSSSKSGRPTSLDVDQGQGTSSSVGHFPYFDQSRKKTRAFEYSEAAVTNAAPETGDKTETTVLDYPRPAAPATEDTAQQHQQQVHRNEEEVPPKKNRKNNVQEYPHWKIRTTQPTRDPNGGNKGQSMGVRIGQPAGKAFGV